MSDVTDHRSPAKDCYMDASAVDTNRNVDAVLKIGTLGKGETFAVRTILEFDVSFIPTGATIDATKLRWYCSTAATITEASKVYRCTRSNWVENQVTWNSYSAGNAWTAAGGDYDAVTPTPVAFNIAIATGWQEITGLAAFVTDALANRSGLVELILRIDDETATSHAAAYEERGDTDYRPSLVIEWTSPTGEHWLSVVAAKDTYVRSVTATTNYGAATVLYWGLVGADIHRSLLEFSLSGVPAQARIVSARYGQQYSGLGIIGTAYRLTRDDWVEAEATYNVYKTGSNWTAAGGDYDATKSVALGTVTIGWYHLTITSLVQDAINARQRILELLLRKDNEGAVGRSNLKSRENTDYADPYVVIRYEPHQRAGATPMGLSPGVF